MSNSKLSAQCHDIRSRPIEIVGLILVFFLLTARTITRICSSKRRECSKDCERKHNKYFTIDIPKTVKAKMKVFVAISGCDNK